MNKATKKRLLHRLKIIEGQVRGLQSLVEGEDYCIDIINQSLAAKQALSRVEDLLLENHLSSHVIDQVESGQKQQAINEIVSIYKLSKKK